MSLQTQTFSYGDLSYHSYSNAYKLELIVTEETTDIASNTSVVSYVLWLKSGSNNRFSLYHIGATITLDGTVVATRDRYSTAQVSLGYNSSVALLSGTTTIYHDSDGSKTIPVAFAIDMESGSYVPGSLSASGYSMTLTAIPRKSTLSIGNGTLGSALSFAVTSNSSSFKHTLTFRAENASKTDSRSETPFSNKSGLSGETEQTWTPPLEWANLNTEGTVVSILVELETLSGSESIGVDSKIITCSIPESVKPSCSVSVVDATGYDGTYGYIKGKTILAVEIAAIQAYGSEIKTYATSVNGGVYSGSEFYTGVLKSAGDQTISATVTDKRGRQGRDSVNISVLDYENPAISKLTAVRCASDGSADDKGEYVLVTFSAKVSSLNEKNTAAYELRYKKAGSVTYESITFPTLANVYDVVDSTYILSADSTNSYEIEIAVTDAFGTTTKPVLASTGFILMHWKADGRGLGIGKRAEESGALDMGLNIRMNEKRLSGLPIPMSDDEAVNKAYTDSLTIPVQYVPEFVNTIEECTDTTKIYVLPDGFLYGYILTVIKPFTNQIPSSIDSTGATIGLMLNKRYNSSGLLKDSTDGHNATGYIPASGGDVVRFSEFPFNTSMEFASSSYVWFYDSSFAKVNGFAASSESPGSAYQVVRDDDGNIIQFVVPSDQNIAYFTVCCTGLADGSIVTVNEEITDEEAVKAYAWANTGHAFVPADYEDRIVDLESKTNELLVKVETLEIPEYSEAPEYVRTEAERVAKAVIGVQNENTTTFLCFSDMHNFVGDSEIEVALNHAGQGAELIRKRLPLDGGLVLGDCIYGTTETKSSATDGFLQLGDFLHDALSGLPEAWLIGNHDCIPQGVEGALSASQLFALISRRSRGVKWISDRVRGCCLMDFEDSCIRVICLNTSEISGIEIDVSSMESYSMNRISAAQLQWLCESLAETPAGWTIIVAGHHPLDWDTVEYTDTAGTVWEMNVENAVAVLSAYKNGATVSLSIDGTTVSYDFTGKNTAVLAATIHGHVHNFAVGTLGDSEILRIAIPNGLPGRENSDYENYKEDVSYPKTPGTAKDTSFCVVTIDTNKRKIYAHHYGAGYDREISY